MQFHIQMIPQEIIDECKPENIVEPNRWCCAEIRKCACGLKEAGCLSNLELKRTLAEEGHKLSRFAPGLFVHKTRDIAFSLVADDFGVRHANKENAEHLLKTKQTNAKPVGIPTAAQRSPWNGTIKEQRANITWIFVHSVPRRISIVS